MNIKLKTADAKQWQEYRFLLGNKASNAVEKFQDLKYNEPDKWEYLKGSRRYEGSVPEAMKTMIIITLFTEKDFDHTTKSIAEVFR